MSRCENQGEKMSAVEVSVVVPVYKGVATLKSALDSVLEQVGVNMEVIVIDDGSPDESYKVVEALACGAKGQAIKLIRQKNQGLAKTLNIGVERANAPFIARQDQDDLMVYGRLKRQLEHLVNDPDCAMVGTWAQIYVGEEPTKRFHLHPTQSDALKLFLLFDNPFVHSSVLLRKSAIDAVGGYTTDPERQPPEDYELWSRISRQFELANLPAVLTVYREMPNSMSRVGVDPFRDKVLKISAENLHHYVSSRYTLQQCLILSGLYRGVPGANLSMSPRDALAMIEFAASQILIGRPSPSDEFTEVLANMRCTIQCRYAGMSEFKRLRRKFKKSVKDFFRENIASV
jgi:glycosyltransferase involved in cell wall biosynthesis